MLTRAENKGRPRFRRSWRGRCPRPRTPCGARTSAARGSPGPPRLAHRRSPATERPVTHARCRICRALVLVVGRMQLTAPAFVVSQDGACMVLADRHEHAPATWSGSNRRHQREVAALCAVLTAGSTRCSCLPVEVEACLGGSVGARGGSSGALMGPVVAGDCTVLVAAVFARDSVDRAHRQ